MIGDNVLSFRKKIAKHDWLSTDDDLLSILKVIGVSHSMQLAVEQTSIYLPIFEQRHPDNTWVRTALDQMASRGSVDPTLSFSEVPHSELLAGDDEFLDAISGIDNASDCRDDEQCSIFRLMIAISSAIAARTASYEFENFPRIWREVRDEKQSNLPPQLIASPRAIEVQAYKEKLWSDLANTIAKQYE